MREVAGSRCLNVVKDRLLTPVGLRSLSADNPRLQIEILRRSARARCRLPSGNRLGLADRPLCRRLVEGQSGRPHRGAPVPGWLLAAPGSGVRWVDQRSLRCRIAIHAARLHCPGLECGRSALASGSRLRRPMRRPLGNLSRRMGVERSEIQWPPPLFGTWLRVNSGARTVEQRHLSAATHENQAAVYSPPARAHTPPPFAPLLPFGRCCGLKPALRH